MTAPLTLKFADLDPGTQRRIVDHTYATDDAAHDHITMHVHDTLTNLGLDRLTAHWNLEPAGPSHISFEGRFGLTELTGDTRDPATAPPTVPAGETGGVYLEPLPNGLTNLHVHFDGPDNLADAWEAYEATLDEPDTDDEELNAFEAAWNLHHDARVDYYQELDGYIDYLAETLHPAQVLTDALTTVNATYAVTRTD